MSDRAEKKYDVAISLRWTDVEVARALYEVLRDRLEVFFADEKQEDFVGTDGEESFGHIFRDQARVVVVLYRPDWGSTPFTRAEESAIKQRAWSNGYGFSIWVPMDNAKSIPPYLTPQYVWFDYEQYGVAGLASVIEERVRESGREVRPETAADRLKRIKRRIDLESERRTFEGSQEGVDYVADAYRRLEAVLTAQLQGYESISPDIPFKLKREHDRYVVTSWPYRCTFVLDRYASNSVRGASLIGYLAQHAGERDWQDQWRDVAKFEFRPTLDDDGSPAWEHKGGRYHSLESAVAYTLDDVAERVYKAVEERMSAR